MSINSFSKKFLLIIFFLGLFLRFYRIEEMFSFDFDQEVAANAAYDLLKSGKLSLIGQELSYQGFFLGPIHNWIQIIPYSACSLKPDCVPYFFTSIGLLSAYFLYITVKEIFNLKTATISTLLYLASSVIIGNERGPSSNYFLFLTAIFMLYSLNKYYKGRGKYLIAGSFFGGLALVNFNPIFIFTLIAYFVAAFFSRNRKIKVLLISFLAAFINIIPLFIFNYRHQNLLYNSFVKFISEANTTENIVTKPFFVIKDILIPYFNNFLFLNNNIIYQIATLCVLISGFYILLKKRQPIFNFLLIWIVFTILGFSFYSRHIPDYYFVQTLLPFIVITAYILSKRFSLFIIFISIFLYSNILNLLTTKPAISYKLKKEVVNYVVSDARGENYNVYYNFPRGLNNGYQYLFKASGKEPKDYSKSLYILDFYEDKDFSTLAYYKTFKSKIKNIKSIGTMKILTIKE